MFSKNKTVVFLGQWNDKDPLFRIYFQTLSTALKNIETKVLVQGRDFCKLSELTQDNLVINFFYKDQDAIEEIVQAQFSQSMIICFGSDVYDFSAYANACKVTDIFFCPSKIHRSVLKTTVNKPVEILIEAIDPLIQYGNLSPDFSSRRFVWFGFPESYSKSMLTIVPVIQLAIKYGWIDSFTVISLPALKNYLPNEFKFIDYDECTISNTLLGFDYSLLSHFPLDGHMNTYIKSSNKAIYSVMSGLLPICSSTPNYQDTLSVMKLENFLFQSPNELANLLMTLKSVDQNKLQENWATAQKKTLESFSEKVQFNLYMKVLTDFFNDKYILKEEDHLMPVITYLVPEQVIKFRFYWRQKKKRIFSVLRKLLK